MRHHRERRTSTLATIFVLALIAYATVAALILGSI